MADAKRSFNVGRVGKTIGMGFFFVLFFVVSLVLPFLPHLFRGRIPRFRKLHAYAFFFLVMTFLFTYLTLPFDKIQARLKRVAGDKLGIEIDGDFKKSWFTGVFARNLVVTPRTKPGEKVKAMEVDEVTARLAVLPLFLGRVKANVNVRVGGGDIEAAVTRKGKDTEVAAKVNGVDLKALSLLHRLAGRSIGGTMSGSADLSLAQNVAASTGKIDLRVDDALMDSFQVPTAFGPLTIPTLGLGQVRVDVELADGAAKIKEIKLTGSKDIEASVEGYAVLQEDPRRTTVRVYLKFKFSDAFFQRNPKFNIIQNDASLARAKRPDGFYGFLIEGPIAEPARLQRTPMPQPPPNLTPPKGGVAPPSVAGPMRPPPPPGVRRPPGLGEIERRLGK